MCIYKSRGSRRVVFLFRRHPVDYSRVVVIIIIIFFSFRLFPLYFRLRALYSRTARGEGHGACESFHFLRKKYESCHRRGTRAPAPRFFTMPLYSPSLFASPFSFPAFAFPFWWTLSINGRRGDATRQETKKNCIYNIIIKNIRLRTPTADDHRI